MSIDHKPDSPDELSRIVAAGSNVFEGRVDGTINLSRSIGDLGFKQNKALTPEQFAVTANPDV
jgi:protein phosphatase 1G